MMSSEVFWGRITDSMVLGTFMNILCQAYPSRTVYTAVTSFSLSRLWSRISSQSCFKTLKFLKSSVWITSCLYLQVGVVISYCSMQRRQFLQVNSFWSSMGVQRTLGLSFNQSCFSKTLDWSTQYSSLFLERYWMEAMAFFRKLSSMYFFSRRQFLAALNRGSCSWMTMDLRRNFLTRNFERKEIEIMKIPRMNSRVRYSYRNKNGRDIKQPVTPAVREPAIMPSLLSFSAFWIYSARNFSIVFIVLYICYFILLYIIINIFYK